MFGAGFIQDMNNRMKQNRELRTSKKEKFKDNRDSIYSDVEENQLIFPEVSKEKQQSVIKKIREKAFKRRQKDLIFQLFFILFLVCAFVFFFLWNK